MVRTITRERLHIPMHTFFNFGPNQGRWASIKGNPRTGCFSGFGDREPVLVPRKSECILKIGRSVGAGGVRDVQFIIDEIGGEITHQIIHA